MTFKLSREARIVFLAAAGESGDSDLIQLLGDSPDWGHLLRLATNHKASAALCRAIERSSFADIPEGAMQQLRRSKMVSDFHSAHLHDKLVGSLQVLSERQIPVMLLKGAAMGATVYKSFNERPMADLDLLVHPENAQVALSALHDSGWSDAHNPARDDFYSEHHHLAPLRDAQGSGHAIELHLRAFPPPNPFGDVAGMLWKGATTTGPEYKDSVTPSRTDLLVYACVHFAWSHKAKKGAWRTIRDIAELSRYAVDWQGVVDTARNWRAASSCYWTMRLSQTLSRVSVPREVLDELSPYSNGAVANALERHLVSEALPGELPACPSDRLSSLLWRIAIRPQRYGHTRGQPADHTHAWRTSGGSTTVDSEKRPGPLQRLRNSFRYGVSLLFPGDSSIRAPYAGNTSLDEK